jgi:hypothetical protein
MLRAPLFAMLDGFAADPEPGRAGHVPATASQLLSLNLNLYSLSAYLYFFSLPRRWQRTS